MEEAPPNPAMKIDFDTSEGFINSFFRKKMKGEFNAVSTVNSLHCTTHTGFLTVHDPTLTVLSAALSQPAATQLIASSDFLFQFSAFFFSFTILW